jgi:hypothetical protein
LHDAPPFDDLLELLLAFLQLDYRGRPFGLAGFFAVSFDAFFAVNCNAPPWLSLNLDALLNSLLTLLPFDFLGTV